MGRFEPLQPFAYRRASWTLNAHGACMRSFLVASAVFLAACPKPGGAGSSSSGQMNTDPGDSGQPPMLRNISGRVFHDLCYAAPGVTVSVVGTSTTTTADAEGRFTIDNVADGATLRVEGTGYEP